MAEIDKSKLFGKIDYTDRTIENIPDNITIEAMDIKNDTLYLTLKEYAERAGNLNSVIDPSYFDVNGGSYYLNTWSFTGSSKDGEPNLYYYVIPNFKDNFYLLRWSYKIDQLLDQPVAVGLN
jgi:hypothetical protein